MSTMSIGQHSVILNHTPYVKLRWAKAKYSWEEVTNPPDYPKLELSAIGLIEVENVSFVKQVIVHCSLDRGWVDTSATYVASIGYDHELWTFTAGTKVYPPYFGANAIEFVIRLSAKETTTWDNNYWQNYIVYGPGAGMPKPSIALGRDNLRVAESSLTPYSDGQTSDGRVVFDVRATLKNIAYQKEVLVVYTTDGWRTIQIGNALWNLSYSLDLESWQFNRVLPASTQKVDFAVAYKVAGNTYWDNNDGRNYSIDMTQRTFNALELSERREVMGGRG